MTIRGPGATRIPSLEAAVHRFSVGQIVRMRSRSGVFPKTDEIFRITRTLPARDNLLQYRLRNDGENYERVATEDILELVGAELSAEGAADMSWTGHNSADASAASKGARPLARGKTRK
jgi:hypothetical protein